MPPADPAQSDRICARFVLPVSGLRVALTSPTGEEDLLLSEYGGSDTTLALSLAQRLARADDDGDAAVPAWSELPAADLDVLLLRLRPAALPAPVVVARRVLARRQAVEDRARRRTWRP